MGEDSMQADISESEKSSLLEETQRVLGEQVKIVQEQQAQATRIIRVALTVGGLLLTGISIFVSSPLLPKDGLNISDISSFEFLLSGALAVYILLFVLIIFGKIFSSALIVLSPESGGLNLLVDNPIAIVLSFYRQYFLPQPLSDFLLVSEEEKERMSLRPGVDSEEIQNILKQEDSKEDIMERIVSYNSGCIQGNEQLIEDNREHLSEIYGIGVLAIFMISIALLIGFSIVITSMM